MKIFNLLFLILPILICSCSFSEKRAQATEQYNYTSDEVKDYDDEDVVRLYYNNGQLRTETQLKNGKAHGVNKTYYKSGQLFTEGFFINGKEDGPLTVYYENGNLIGKGYYKNGKRHGSLKTYYENGVLQNDCNYLNGKLDGIAKIYSETSELLYEVMFERGVAMTGYQYSAFGKRKLSASQLREVVYSLSP